MNGVAHYLFGLLIMLFIVNFQNIQDPSTAENNRLRLSATSVILIIVISFFSHAVVDAIAHFTYHPSDSNWSNPVYAGWHLATYVAEAIAAVYFLRTDIRYTIAMLASVGFDLWDWSIARPLEKFAGLNLPGIHFIASSTEQFLFGWAPSLRDMQWALLVEVFIVGILFLVWKRTHENSNLSNYPRNGSWKEIAILIAIFGSLRLLTLV